MCTLLPVKRYPTFTSHYAGVSQLLFRKRHYGTHTFYLVPVYSRNATYSFRVYDLIMKIAGYSDQAFGLCESSGILTQLLEELNTDDLLVRMNAIELLNEVTKRRG
jgi:hypothetical protein